MNRYELLTESQKVVKTKELLSMLSDEDLQAIIDADEDDDEPEDK